MKDGTSKPGVRVSHCVEEKLISKFRGRYRNQREDLSSNVPTWATFKRAIKVGEDILLNKLESQDTQLFVYFEYLDEVYIASIDEIRRFIRCRAPWEDYDLYIFPESLEWCIAFTHLQMSGIDVYITGEVWKIDDLP